MASINPEPREYDIIKRVLVNARASEVGGCFAPADTDTPDECLDGECYCARWCEKVALACSDAIGAPRPAHAPEHAKSNTLD